MMAGSKDSKKDGNRRTTAQKDTNQKCSVCHNNIVYNRYLNCDLCTEPICVSCTKLTENIYDYMEEQGIEIPFLCSPCRREMPKIRELLQMKEKHQNLELVVEKLSEDVKTLQKNPVLTERVVKLENVIEQKQINSNDFPALDKITNQTKQINQVIQKQHSLDAKLKKQSEEKEEEKRIEERENNLIVYGIPEQHEDSREQIKEDYYSITNLYKDRIKICKEDIINITRLGSKKENQIRPIRICFECSDIRTRFLRNNKNLVIYDEEFPKCTASFCNLEESHKHIYISTDKTKQQRETEKELREELKKRKSQGETNIIIRNYKIIKATESAHPRWADIVQNGL